MKNIYFTIGILVFVLTTIFVMASDTHGIKKVQFTNQNFIVSHENTDIKTENVNVNFNKSNIQNKELQTDNQNLNIKNNDTELNYEPFHSQENNFSNNSSFDNQENKYNDKLTNYKNQQDKLRKAKNQLSTQKTQPKTNNRYLVRNIDWSVWKSDFINKITDDSEQIHSLDDYGLGTWFYYSFTVTNTGEIKNITIRSMYLEPQDRVAIEKLIKSYEYQDITVFPANSKRATAKIEAVMVIGSEEKRAKPSDFNDKEQIRIKL
ncbi:hypothetical protein HDR58_08855 [bacterium]|nr:hypothetical protein [bacterium]